jgi:hypothetical protein
MTASATAIVTPTFSWSHVTPEDRFMRKAAWFH